MSAKQAIPLLKETYSKWSDHGAPRLGASVAFYSLLSFAPILVLVTALIALVFGQSGAQGALVGEARQMIGSHGAETVQSMLKHSQSQGSGIFASTVAFITLLFGASGVFAELRSALNIIWEAPEETSSGVWGMIKQRLFSFGMVLSVGFLLLVTLILSAGLSYVGHAFGQAVPIPPVVLQVLNFVVSVVVIGVVFALMFKYVPNAKVPWHYAIVGAVGTALLFTIGKLLLGLYLGKASVTSTYGAAGSLVAVIIWIYYSAQIFFFGGEFTHVYAQAHAGKKARPEKSAVPNAPQTDTAEADAPATRAEPVTSVSPALPKATVIPAANQIPSPVGTVDELTPVVSAKGVPVRRQSLSKLAMALAFGFLLGRAFAPSRDES